MNFHFFYKLTKTTRSLLKFTNEEFKTNEWFSFLSPKIFLVVNTEMGREILAEEIAIKTVWGGDKHWIT